MRKGEKRAYRLGIIIDIEAEKLPNGEITYHWSIYSTKGHAAGMFYKYDSMKNAVKTKVMDLVKRILGEVTE